MRWGAGVRRGEAERPRGEALRVLARQGSSAPSPVGSGARLLGDAVVHEDAARDGDVEGGIPHRR